MSFHSATHIGNIHRLLQQPLVSGQEDLRKALKQSNGDALAYVCTDIERLPVDKFAKDDMVNPLILWVCFNLYTAYIELLSDFFFRECRSPLSRCNR